MIAAQAVVGAGVFDLLGGGINVGKLLLDEHTARRKKAAAAATEAAKDK